MPAYDYRCTACGDVFEVKRRMGVAGDESCPACGADAKRVYNSVGVAFKGAGFHNTDYRPRPKEESGAPAPSAPACPAKVEGSSACTSCPAAAGE